MARKPTAQDGTRATAGIKHKRFYALLSLGCFIASLVPLLLLLWKADLITSIGLVGPFYYLILSLVGLCVSALLFGALQSFARYRGRHLGGILELGGPIVALALFIIGGFYLAPPGANFLLTVYVHGKGGNGDIPLKNSGYVVLHLGGSPRREPIGSEGQALFPEIAASFRGQKVDVLLDSDFYELCDANQKIALDKSDVYLCVRRKAGHVSGRVQAEDGEPLAGVSLSVAGLATKTDSAGHFDLIIPEKDLKPELELQASAVGYRTGHSTVVPNANETTITLKHLP